MSRQATKALLFLAGAIFFMYAVALAEQSKTISIYSDSVLPSGQALKAGKYQVDINETSRQVTFRKGDKVVATSGSQIVEKPEKNTCSQARFIQKESKPELHELRFGGERRTILLIHGGS